MVIDDSSCAFYNKPIQLKTDKKAPLGDLGVRNYPTTKTILEPPMKITHRSNKIQRSEFNLCLPLHRYKVVIVLKCPKTLYTHSKKCSKSIKNVMNKVEIKDF